MISNELSDELSHMYNNFITMSQILYIGSHPSIFIDNDDAPSRMLPNIVSPTIKSTKSHRLSLVLGKKYDTLFLLKIVK